MLDMAPLGKAWKPDPLASLAIFARGRLLGLRRKAAPAMSILSKGHTCL